MWRSGIFRGNLRRFSHVLSSTERFWCIFWGSGVFWGLLMLTHGFWAVLKSSWRFWGIVWCSFVCGGVLRCSNEFCVDLKMFLKVLRHPLMFDRAFWEILKGYWRFWGVSWRSGVFWGFWKVCKGSDAVSDILRCIEASWCTLLQTEWFLKVLRYSLMLLGCSEAFSWVLSCFEKLMKILRHVLTFWCVLGVQRQSHWFCMVLKGSWWFCGILICSGVFWSVLRCIVSSELFWIVSEGSETYFWHSGVFWAILRCFHRFWVDPSGSEVFSNTLVCSKSFRGILMDSESFWKVPEGCKTFSDVLKCTTAFWGVLMDSELFRKQLNILSYSLAFWRVLKHFHGFWLFMKGFWRFWGIFYRFGCPS